MVAEKKEPPVEAGGSFDVTDSPDEDTVYPINSEVSMRFISQPSSSVGSTTSGPCVR